MNVLSIDAWADEDGWTWNAWYTVGQVSKQEFEGLKTTKQQRLWFRNQGYITTANKREVDIDDDGHNTVVVNTKTREPLFAIEYGPEY